MCVQILHSYTFTIVLNLKVNIISYTVNLTVNVCVNIIYIYYCSKFDSKYDIHLLHCKFDCKCLRKYYIHLLL